jgi:hypothetical protein
MKRLISATLALSLLGATAASAAPYDHNNQAYGNGYGSRDRGDYDRGRGDNGAAFAGIGLLAFAAILASQNHHHYHHGWYNRDRGSYGYGDNRGHDYNHGDRNGGYNDHR